MILRVWLHWCRLFRSQEMSFSFVLTYEQFRLLLQLLLVLCQRVRLDAISLCCWDFRVRKLELVIVVENFEADLGAGVWNPVGRQTRVLLRRVVHNLGRLLHLPSLGKPSILLLSLEQESPLVRVLNMVRWLLGSSEWSFPFFTWN